MTDTRQMTRVQNYFISEVMRINEGNEKIKLGIELYKNEIKTIRDSIEKANKATRLLNEAYELRIKLVESALKTKRLLEDDTGLVPRRFW